MLPLLPMAVEEAMVVVTVVVATEIPLDLGANPHGGKLVGHRSSSG